MPTPFNYLVNQAGKVGSKALREVLSGARQLPEELGAATGIVRNALSNVSEIPVQAAEALRLGPATGRIAREAYGGSGNVRGAVLGDLPSPVPPRAPVPAWVGKAAESAPRYPRPRGGALVPTTSPSAPSTASRDLARDQFGRSLEAPVGTVGPNIPPSAPSSVNPNYFPDPSFRNIQPVSITQPRLDLRAPRGAQATRPYKTSKGAERPEGTSVGGQYYRPDIMSSPGNEAVVRESLEATRAVPPANVVRTPAGQLEMFSPTGNVMFPSDVVSRIAAPVRASIGNVAPLPRRGGIVLDPSVDDVVRQPVRASIGNVTPLPGRGVALDPSVDDVVGPTAAMANAANLGARLVDLNDPVLQRLLLGGAGVGSFVAGISAMQQPEQSEGERKRSEGQMPMSSEEETTPSNDLVSQMQAQQAGMDMARALAARLFTDEAGRPIAEPGNGGTTSQQANRNVSPGSITTNGDQRENVRAALAQSDPAAALLNRALEPRDPSSYKSAADYFAAEREYAQQEGMRGLMREAGEKLAQRMQTEAQLGAWAEANPELMYRLQQKQLANPAMDQQSGQSVVTSQVVSPMGPDPTANAIGYGVYKTDAEMGDTSANDLAEATRPLVQPKLSNLSALIRQRLQEQAAMRGGV